MNTESPERRRPSVVARVLRTLFWALLTAFVIGFVIGTLLRREIETPMRYIGQRAAPAESDRPTPRVERVRTASALATHPGHVTLSRPRILVSGDHEEQIG